MKITISSANTDQMFDIIKYMKKIGATFDVRYTECGTTQTKTKKDAASKLIVYETMKHLQEATTMQVYAHIKKTRMDVVGVRQIDRNLKRLFIEFKVTVTKQKTDIGGYHNIWKIVK